MGSDDIMMNYQFHSSFGMTTIQIRDGAPDEDEPPSVVVRSNSHNELFRTAANKEGIIYSQGGVDYFIPPLPTKSGASPHHRRHRKRKKKDKDAKDTIHRTVDEEISYYGAHGGCYVPPDVQPLADNLYSAIQSIDGAVESVMGFIIPVKPRSCYSPSLLTQQKIYQLQANEPDVLPLPPVLVPDIEDSPTIEVDYDGQQDMIFSMATSKDNEPGNLSLVSREEERSGPRAGMMKWPRSTKRSSLSPHNQLSFQEASRPAATLWKKVTTGGTSPKKTPTLRFDEDGTIELEEVVGEDKGRLFSVLQKFMTCRISRKQIEQLQELDRVDDVDGDILNYWTRLLAEDARVSPSESTIDTDPTCEVEGRDSPPSLATSSGSTPWGPFEEKRRRGCGSLILSGVCHHKSRNNVGPTYHQEARAYSHIVTLTPDDLPSQYVHQDETLEQTKEGRQIHTIRMSRVPTDVFMKGTKYLV